MCLQSSVSAFIKRVCGRLIPKAMWGSDHNLKAFRDAIDFFVRLRRNDQVRLVVAYVCVCVRVYVSVHVCG